MNVTLGEMNGIQLGESTMQDERRTLIQYTTEDAKKEIEQIRYYQSNRAELVQQIGEITRRQVLFE